MLNNLIWIPFCNTLFYEKFWWASAGTLQSCVGQGRGLELQTAGLSFNSWSLFAQKRDHSALSSSSNVRSNVSFNTGKSKSSLFHALRELGCIHWKNIRQQIESFFKQHMIKLDLMTARDCGGKKKKFVQKRWVKTSRGSTDAITDHHHGLVQLGGQDSSKVLGFLKVRGWVDGIMALKASYWLWQRLRRVWSLLCLLSTHRRSQAEQGPGCELYSGLTQTWKAFEKTKKDKF